MTIQDLINWCKDKQSNRQIILINENRELEYTDIGLLFNPIKINEQKDMFNERD